MSSKRLPSWVSLFSRILLSVEVCLLLSLFSAHSTPNYFIRVCPGFLTGRYKKPEDFEAGDFRTALPRLQKEVWEQNYKIVEDFERLAKAKGCTPGQLSLAWLMAQGPNIVPIPGVRFPSSTCVICGSAEASFENRPSPRST